MASVIISGDTSGTVTLSAPAVAGSTTQTLVNVTGTLAPLVSGTAQATTSGTFKDFTGIPSWVKRITVMHRGVSGSGTSAFLVQIGTGGTPTTSGYIGGISSVSITTANVTGGASATTGFTLNTAVAAAAYNGSLIITNVSSNDWVAFGTSSAGSTGTYLNQTVGGVTLSGTLDLVRFTTVNGTDTFDAGTVNILYE